MGKIHDVGVKMTAVDVTAEVAKVRHWAEYLLSRERRGLGGTIEDAAYQAERKWGVPATILLRCWRRDTSGIKATNWLRVKLAYEAAVEATRRQADHQRMLAEKAGANATSSRAYAAASLLDRPPGQGAAEAIDGNTGRHAKAGDGTVEGRQRIPETTAPDDPVSRPSRGGASPASSDGEIPSPGNVNAGVTGRRDGHL